MYGIQKKEEKELLTEFNKMVNTISRIDLSLTQGIALLKNEFK